MKPAKKYKRNFKRFTKEELGAFDKILSGFGEAMLLTFQIRPAAAKSKGKNHAR